LNFDAFSLKGKNALVTGSRTGLGAGIAIGLAGAGANVVVHGSKAEGFEEVLSKIEAGGAKAVRARADLAETKSCEDAIAPGYMETDVTTALRSDPVRSRQILERIPAGRWGNPRDLAGPAVFLASSASDYMHGHVLVVDGGWLAR
jgi:NAD(P)-dependent dehydrogenase (short-subunit alcohol dehydrogenase family)